MQTFKIEKNETQCVVTWRHFHITALFGLIVLAGVTVAGVFILHTGLIQREIIVILFSLPVWGLWLFMFVAIVHTLFGKTTFVLNKNGLDTVFACLVFEREKQFDLADIFHFEKHFVRYTGRQPVYAIRVVFQNDQTSKHFLVPIVPVKDLDDLCNQLNAFLETLKQRGER